MFLTREKFLRLSVMVLMVPIMFFGAAQANQNDGPDVTPAQRVEVEVAPIDDVAAPELTPELTGEPVSEPTQQTPSHPCDLTPYSDEDILADRIPGDSLADLAEAVAAPIPDVVVGFHNKIKRHPFMKSAAQRVCEAKYEILHGKSGYYPKINMSLSGGNKFIDETTRSDEYGGTNSPEYDGKGLNATLTISQHLWDWGRLSSLIEGSQQGHHAARIERSLTLGRQLYEFFRVAIDHNTLSQSVAHFDAAYVDIEANVETMRQRFKAGAARLADLRHAQIIGLEIEGEISKAQRLRLLNVENLQQRFDVGAKEAQEIVAYFIANRPHVPATVPGEASLQARLIRRNIERVKSDYRRLQAERKPSFTGLLTTRGWDINERYRCNDTVPATHPDRGSGRVVNGETVYYRNQNCRTYEVVGSIEFSMPLFDGGANSAQRGGINAQRIGLESELSAQKREHEAEGRRLQDFLNDLLKQIEETEARRVQLQEQAASAEALQRGTRSDPLRLLQLQQQLAGYGADLINMRGEAEKTRLELLAISGTLPQILNLTLGDTGC